MRKELGTFLVLIFCISFISAGFFQPTGNVVDENNYELGRICSLYRHNFNLFCFDGSSKNCDCVEVNNWLTKRSLGRLRCALCIEAPEISCEDGIQNQAEDGIDCGGACEDCEEELICEDSDKGRDYFARGSTGKTNIRKKDRCSGDSLREYYCEGNEVKSEVVSCEFGCFSGECFEEEVYLGDEKKYFEFNFGEYKFPYYSNYDLEKNEIVEKAVIVIHGNSRTAQSYFDSIMRASEIVDETSETIIIAPHFLIKEDVYDEDLFYWDSNSYWKIGHKSSRSLNSRKSSFDIVDNFVEELADKDKFPNLKEIVIVGHSAGGQFVNRYAAGNQVDDLIDITYIIANPSSYLYFGDERWVRGKLKEPDYWTKNFLCTSYNDYKYGLDNKNSYMKRLIRSELEDNYEERDVVYLLGEEDNDPKGSALDIGCEARLQGRNRLDRGKKYFNYLEEELPNNNHKKVYVKNVGHSARGMFTSTEGVGEIFS